MRLDPIESIVFSIASQVPLPSHPAIKGKDSTCKREQNQGGAGSRRVPFVRLVSGQVTLPKLLVIISSVLKT